MNEEISHQDNTTENGIPARWQTWLKWGPWIVLIGGMAGVWAQAGATLDLIANVKGQGAGWSVTQAANTIGLGFMNSAIVFFLFLALRILIAGVPKLFRFPADAPKPAPEPEPEAAPQEAETEGEASPDPSEPAAETTEEDKREATE